MGTVSELVSDRRDQREDAYKLRPRDWVGTATNEALAFPYPQLITPTATCSLRHDLRPLG